MAAESVITAFRLRSRLTKILSGMYYGSTTKNGSSENINQQQQQQNINQCTSEGVSKYTQEKTCAEVSF